MKDVSEEVNILWHLRAEDLRDVFHGKPFGVVHDFMDFINAEVQDIGDQVQLELLMAIEEKEQSEKGHE